MLGVDDPFCILVEFVCMLDTDVELHVVDVVVDVVSILEVVAVEATELWCDG